MQQQILKRRSFMKPFLTVVTIGFLSLLLASYTVQKKIADDFLKQLGISKNDANNKIAVSFLEGYLDAYGVKNIKNILAGNRTAIAKDLLVYTRQQVSSPAFIKQYDALREQKKPIMPVVKTPEEMQEGIINDAKKSIADLELKLKKADASSKIIFEKTLEAVRKQLLQAQDPNNKSVAGYRQGYPVLIKDRDLNYAKQIEAWESKYPASHLQFIKNRLQQFMLETADIDFSAELVEKKGVKYFVNKTYESKPERWKMAFRAGKEVVEPARIYVQEWINALP